MACPAILCANCPWRRSSPKAGEPGGSVPVTEDRERMRGIAQDLSGDGMRVMQCHKSSDAAPKACAGFLSVVGYESIGVRLAVMSGIIRAEDVGRPRKGLYSSLAEMVREADHIDIGDALPGQE